MLTQDLSSCTRVYASRTKYTRPKERQERQGAPITVLASPSPDGPLFAIPYAPGRAQVSHFQRQSSFVAEREIAYRRELRVRARTEAMLAGLRPVYDKQGRVIRGAWLRVAAE